MKNHLTNGSWKLVSKHDKPSGRRVHRMVWVYKFKHDWTAKARLCVQGCTLESGVDFDQTFSSTLRYCSARALFAFAARRNCYVRSIDFVAAYLQGEFVEGEVVYCSMPPGHEQYDADGNGTVPARRRAPWQRARACTLRSGSRPPRVRRRTQTQSCVNEK